MTVIDQFARIDLKVVEATIPVDLPTTIIDGDSSRVAITFLSVHNFEYRVGLVDEGLDMRQWLIQPEDPPLHFDFTTFGRIVSSQWIGLQRTNPAGTTITMIIQREVDSFAQRAIRWANSLRSKR